MKKISIVIPIYNVEQYLRECIDSVIKQTYENLEIILVNDGSKDNSLNICKEYLDKDKRIRIIDQKNAGLSAARNVGLEASTGEYVMFIDSDDYMDLNACKVLYNAIEGTDYEFVSANFVFTDSNGKPWKKPKFSNKFKNKELTIKNYRESFYFINAPVWNKIFKREYLIENNLRFEVGLYAEDAIFTTLLYLKAQKAYYIKDVVYYYRQREVKKGNLSISFNCSLEYFDKINTAYKIIDDNFRKYKEVNFYRYFYARSVAYILYKIVDSVILSDVEKISVMEKMRWFFETKKEIGIPLSSDIIDIVTEGIINKEYNDVLKNLKILYEARQYMSNEKKEKMARPDYSKYLME